MSTASWTEVATALDSARNSLDDSTLTIPLLLANLVDIPGKSYKIGRYAVTQSQWMAVMGTNPSTYKYKGKGRPVENISWNDCQTFIAKLNENPDVKKFGLVIRLPLEDEWEYACGEEGRSMNLIGWFSRNSNHMTHPVGEKKPNAFGLYDMHGNVWEWTNSTDNDGYVVRGGSWCDKANNCTSDARLSYKPDCCRNNVGFRLFASVETK